jgi:fatty-acid desaturase
MGYEKLMKKLLKLLKWILIVFIILVILFALLTRSGISPYRCDRITDVYPTFGWVLCGDNYWNNHEKYWYSNENE